MMLSTTLVFLFLLPIKATKRILQPDIPNLPDQISLFDIPEEVRLLIYSYNPAEFFSNPTVCKEWALKRNAIMRSIREDQEQDIVDELAPKIKNYILKQSPSKLINFKQVMKTFASNNIPVSVRCRIVRMIAEEKIFDTNLADYDILNEVVSSICVGDFSLEVFIPALIDSLSLRDAARILLRIRSIFIDNDDSKVLDLFILVAKTWYQANSIGPFLSASFFGQCYLNGIDAEMIEAIASTNCSTLNKIRGILSSLATPEVNRIQE